LQQSVILVVISHSSTGSSLSFSSADNVTVVGWNEQQGAQLMMSLKKKRHLLAFRAGATTTAKQTSHKHAVVKNRFSKKNSQPSGFLDVLVF